MSEMEFVNSSHRYNVIAIKRDYSLLQCESCGRYFIFVNNAVIDIVHTELLDLKNSLQEIAYNNPNDFSTKFLVSVSGFKKIQLCLSFNELNTMIELIQESLIILEAKNILAT